MGKILGKVQVILSRLWRLLSKLTKKMTKRYLRRSLLKRGGRQGRRATRGFVLPTVTMVLLVVGLLTTSMVLRSFDRSKNAHNFRVNEATLNAAAPALDRARAKIEELFDDPTLPRGTPTDEDLLGAMINERYRFGDETPLKLVFNVDGDDKIGEEDTAPDTVENGETVTTAWKFPVDTDNNGKFDTFTLYGILFRSPLRDAGGFKRRRNPLEARTAPIDDFQLGRCKSPVKTSASFVGNSGWNRSGNRIKKGIFVYAANVPITKLTTDLSSTKYEEFSGGRKGFSALEYQQDRSRIPLIDKAVVYRDDLAILPDTTFNMNGGVITNSNLLIGNKHDDSDVRLFLVSSPDSCYYEEQLSKVIVGGNIGAGGIDSTSDEDNADIDLFEVGGPSAKEQDFGKANKTVTAEGGATLSYNTFAFNERIDYMVNAALWRGNKSKAKTERTSTGEDPEEVKDRVAKRLEENPGMNAYEVRREELENYFRDRTRQVPFAEIGYGESALKVRELGTLTRLTETTIDSEAKAKTFFGTYTEGSDRTGTNPLRPPYQWMYPFKWDDNSGSENNSYTGLAQALTQPPGTDPDQLGLEEKRVGDRVLVGNNLPRKIYDPGINEFVDAAIYEQVVKYSVKVEGGENRAEKWLMPNGPDNSNKDRIRKSQVQELPDGRLTDRDNFWELSAAKAQANDMDNVGGLRIVTSTGLYLPANMDISVPKAFATQNIPKRFIIWPDYMPVPNGREEVLSERKSVAVSNTATVANDHRPYLRMRTTAVYHYKSSYYNGKAVPVKHQTPLACVTTFYDPSYDPSKKNSSDSDLDISSLNNGTVYTGKKWLLSKSIFGTATFRKVLYYEAVLIYPDGREVNPLLKSALKAIDNREDLSLAQRTAIDAAICDLQPYIGDISSAIDANTIKETAFLDPRQVKAIDAHSRRVKWNGTNYEFDDVLGTPTLETGDIVTLDGFSSSALNFSRKPIVVTSGNFTIKGERPSVTANETGWLTETLSGRYDLSIEERQPLEIRATVIDLEKLRKKTIGSGTPTEYLLPNSGIVYATREDAIPDKTTKGDDGEASLELSATDFLLDPKRRPNAIMLINGMALNRGDSNDYRANEKGLILASNLPVYIKGDFNLHTGNKKQEFTTDLAEDWMNFYSRNTLNNGFACRKDEFGSGTCNPGDKWRAATVIADSVTLLSEDFREGFRNEGDYDLNNHLGDAKSIRLRLENGFYTNNFVTSHEFKDETYSQNTTASAPKNSSYFNNSVTPIQRRAKGSPEYLMEVCPRLPVSECGAGNWYVYATGVSGDEDDLLSRIKSSKRSTDVIGENLENMEDEEILQIIPSGTTILAPEEKHSNYARRVAFLRNYSKDKCKVVDDSEDCGHLILDTNGQPIPIGIENINRSRGKIRPFPYNDIDKLEIPKSLFTDKNAPNTPDQDGKYCAWGTSTTDCSNSKQSLNADGKPYRNDDKEGLWFVQVDRMPTGSNPPSDGERNYGYNHPLFYRTLDGQAINSHKNIDGRKWQPLLEPVLQLQAPRNTTSENTNTLTTVADEDKINRTYWQQQAKNTGNTFNLVFVSGDTPGRPNEDNGGLENLPRFLESWNAGSNARPAKISGGFFQTKRSEYATAPFLSLLPNATLKGTKGQNTGIFGRKQEYEHDNTGGAVPYYNPPKRQWGFDVGLLTQNRDLFAEKFTVRSTSGRNEFFREVSRDDKWVQVLLCAGQKDSEAGGYEIGEDEAQYYNETGITYEYAVSKDQRPDCGQAVNY